MKKRNQNNLVEIKIQKFQINLKKNRRKAE